MNRQAFRSACSIARSEHALSTPTPVSFFRTFSSTSTVFAEENSNSESPAWTHPRSANARQRGRAAASQINKFAGSRPPTASASSAGGANGSNPAFAGAAGSQPKVLDIRNVPAGLGRGRGRGGLFRGRGGASNPVRSTSPTGGSGNRFSGANRGTRGSRGGNRGRGGSTRGSTRGGARGGRRSGAQGEGADKKENNAFGGRRKDPFEVMDPAEQEFDNAMRFGTTTTYNPSLTLEDLAQFAPAVPTSAAGRRATVLQNLSLLGGSEQVGTPRNYHISDAAAQLSESGVRFFADASRKDAAATYLKSKPAAEGEGGEAGNVQAAEEAIRKTITEQAVKGTHESPKFATNWKEMMHSTFLRSETYKVKDMNAFEGKIAALAGKVEVKPAAKKPAAEKPAAEKKTKAKAKAA